MLTENCKYGHPWSKKQEEKRQEEEDRYVKIILNKRKREKREQLFSSRAKVASSSAPKPRNDVQSTEPNAAVDLKEMKFVEIPETLL